MVKLSFYPEVDLVDLP